MASELSRCLAQDEWESAIGIASAYPQQAKEWSKRQGFFEGLKESKVLPLHEACVAMGAPVEVIQAIWQAYPDAARQPESSYQRLPLHCVCRRHAVPAVVLMLINAHPDACLQPDMLGRLPLHYALSNGADPAVVDLLLKFKPEAAAGCDARGWTPLHVACSMGAPTEVVVRLLQAHPEAVVMRTNKGSSVSKCLNKVCPNRAELKNLLAKTKEDFMNGSGRTSRNISSGGNRRSRFSLPPQPRVEDLILC